MNLLAAILASATLAWDATGEPGIAGYRVEEEVNAVWSVSWDVAGTQTTVAFADHTPRTFRVRAFNSAGSGPASNELELQLVTLELSRDLAGWTTEAGAVVDTGDAFFRIRMAGLVGEVGRRSIK